MAGLVSAMQALGLGPESSRSHAERIKQQNDLVYCGKWRLRFRGVPELKEHMHQTGHKARAAELHEQLQSCKLAKEQASAAGDAVDIEIAEENYVATLALHSTLRHLWRGRDRRQFVH